MKKATAVIEKGKDGLFSVYVSEGLSEVALNGQGESVQEAINDMYLALEEVRQFFKESGEPLPAEIANVLEFEFKYDVASLFDYFNQINVSSFARKIGMNEALLRKYKNGLAFASEKQVKKIKEGMNTLANELLNAQLAF
jgi:predicted RNase H-like HicB family nuclease